MANFRTALWVTPYPNTGGTDGINWRLLQDLVYSSDLIGVITVPAGFLTDFASTPAATWSRFPPWGKYGPAAVVHDFLYWTQPCTREQADDVLREAMRVCGVDEFDEFMIYTAVSVGGKYGWAQDAANRAAGKEHVSV